MISWKALYRDKDFLNQFNEDGSENKYADIDRYRLVRFDLLRDGTPFYSLFLRQGQRLIYRRRTFINMKNETTVVYLVGWQKTIDTKPLLTNITSINYIFPDGSIALDDSRNNLEILEFERM